MGSTVQKTYIPDILNSIVGDTIILFNELFPRTYYALTTLLQLGDARPSEIKEFLKKEQLISYRTFLKAIDDLKIFGIVTKEWDKYKIRDEFKPIIKKLALETPYKAAEIIDKTIREELGTTDAETILGSIYEDLCAEYADLMLKYRESSAIVVLEQLYVFSLYILDKAKRAVKMVGKIQDIAERMNVLTVKTSVARNYPKHEL